MHCLPHTVELHLNAKLQLGHYVVKDSLAEYPCLLAAICCLAKNTDSHVIVTALYISVVQHVLPQQAVSLHVSPVSQCC